jgi:hypothetical protein
MTIRSRLHWAMVLLFAAAVAYAIATRESRPSVEDAVFREGGSETSEIARLFRERQSGIVVEGTGTVEKLLPDDLVGSRHQRFILQLASRHTLLVSHNIDLAPRLDSLEIGDEVDFRGQYEWNPRGGLVHWTHHDPAGERFGGWLRHRGRVYR